MAGLLSTGHTPPSCICAPTGGFDGAGDGKCSPWVGTLKLSLPRHLQTAGTPPALQGY